MMTTLSMSHHHLKAPLSRPHCKAVQTGTYVTNADRWIIQLNMYVAEKLLVSPPLICTTIYVSTDTSYWLASLTAVTFCKDPEITPANYGKVVYRQYVMYQHGYLGRAIRKVTQSCIVWKVRNNFPALDNNYLGFSEY